MKPSLVIVGLGNPGSTYAKTRHNIGFQALDRLSEVFGEGEWREKQKLASTVQEGRIVTVPVLLAKPSTYMNRSVDAVRKIVEFYKLNSKEQILVISDDIDLPLGTIRLRKTGGPGTHNGLRSIVEHFGEEFPRIRIGLGTPLEGADLSAWVLSVPPPGEQEALSKSLEKLPGLIKELFPFLSLEEPAPEESSDADTQRRNDRPDDRGQ